MGMQVCLPGTDSPSLLLIFQLILPAVVSWSAAELPLEGSFIAQLLLT